MKTALHCIEHNILVIFNDLSYLVESFNNQVKISCDFVEFVSSKEMVNVLHLLDVGEQVPVVDSEVGGKLLSAVFVREQSYRLLVLVWEGRLRGCECVCMGRGRGCVCEFSILHVSKNSILKFVGKINTLSNEIYNENFLCIFNS